MYLRITIDGIRKEASTKRKWESSRWDQKSERAIGTKEDAKSLNFFLDALTLKINEIKTEMMYSGKIITAEKSWIMFWKKYNQELKCWKNFKSIMTK